MLIIANYPNPDAIWIPVLVCYFDTIIFIVVISCHIILNTHRMLSGNHPDSAVTIGILSDYVCYLDTIISYIMPQYSKHNTHRIVGWSPKTIRIRLSLYYRFTIRLPSDFYQYQPHPLLSSLYSYCFQ